MKLTLATLIFILLSARALATESPILCADLLAISVEDSSARIKSLRKLMNLHEVQATGRPKIDPENATWREIIDQFNFEDQYGNTFHVDPSHSYFALSTTESPLPFSIFDYFRQTVLLNAYLSHLSALDPEAFKNERRKLRKQIPYLKRLLFRHNSGRLLSPFYHFDLLAGQFKYRVLDLNLRSQMNWQLEPEDFLFLSEHLSFVLNIYRERLGVQSSQAALLEEISQQTIERSTLIERLAEDMRSGLILVNSLSSSSRLPSEILHKIDIRTLAGLPQDTGITEVGRYGKSKSDRDEGDELFKTAIALIAANPKNQYVVVELDAARRRLWRRMGFVDLDTSQMIQKGKFYRSGTDFLMIAKVNDILNFLFSIKNSRSSP